MENFIHKFIKTVEPEQNNIVLPATQEQKKLVIEKYKQLKREKQEILESSPNIKYPTIEILNIESQLASVEKSAEMLGISL